MTVPFVAAVAFIGMAMPASASTGIDGFTILSASHGGYVHKCEVVGSADGYQAVVCVDVETYYLGTDDYESGGAMEVLCQTDAGVTVRCANIYAEGVLANAAGGRGYAGSYACGHTYGLCPSGRATIGANAIYKYTNGSPSCYETANSENEVWMVAYAYNTQIELPVSGKTVELNSNFSSGHYLICP